MSAIDEHYIEVSACDFLKGVDTRNLRGSDFYGASELNSSREVLPKGRLDGALHRLNPGLPHDTQTLVSRAA